MKKDDIELLQWFWHRLNQWYNEAKNADGMIRLQKLIDEAKTQPLRDRYVIVTLSLRYRYRARYG